MANGKLNTRCFSSAFGLRGWLVWRKPSAVFLFFSSRRISTPSSFFLRPLKLAEDPEDRIANYLSSAIQHFSADTKLFAGVYLIIHGLIKLFLVTGLLRNRLWAYPLSLWFLGVFIVYHVLSYAHQFDVACASDSLRPGSGVFLIGVSISGVRKLMEA